MRFSDIKIVVIDIDGTLTDGIYQISEDGGITKSFFTRDFYAIEKIMRICRSIIITQSHDKVIAEQLQRIANHSKRWYDALKHKHLSVMCEVEDKEKEIESLLGEGLSWDNVAYIGDAENDIKCMKKAVLSGCPSDAIDEVKEIATYPSVFPGGKGAVYDFCMYILKQDYMENR